MYHILKFFKKVWEFINKINPETRSLIIILLFGYIMYSLINQSTLYIFNEKTELANLKEKKAELYAKETAIEVNRHIRLISHEDNDAFDVLLLSYHNSKQSLQGYKYLYLSCIAEAPKSIEVPLIGRDWSNLDYIYYVDELEKLHNQEIITISNVEDMKITLPKFYRLVKSSEAKAVSFYIIEGKKTPIGIVVMLYKDNNINNMDKAKIVMPSILKLAILLDYETYKK